jgi:uncharacterized phiE125 gp8 family phage protein
MVYSRLDTITAPASQPVTLAEVKAHTRVDFDDDDALLNTLMGAAIEHVETVLGRQLMSATYELHMGGFPAGHLSLPRPPVSSVESVTYRDRDGTEQTFTDFLAYLDRDAPFIAPVTSWPATEDHPDAVVVRFIAGFDQVPDRARVAILSLVSHWYEHREPVGGERIREVPHHITRLLNSTRTWAQA